MPAGRVDTALRQRLEELEGKHGDTVRTADIAEVVESMMATLKGDVAGADENLLHGPQLAEDAKSQAEVDALLASFD